MPLKWCFGKKFIGNDGRASLQLIKWIASITEADLGLMESTPEKLVWENTQSIRGQAVVITGM